jgi:hypothetical protein
MKRIMSIICVLAMVFAMTGCKSSSESNTGDQSNAAATPTSAAVADVTSAAAPTEAIAAQYPDEKVMIGVELYDPTESETLGIQKYFDYLAQTFNVEFKYSEAITDADAEMKFIEDCAIAGCKGFFGYYNVAGNEQASKVLEYGMYYYGGVANGVYDSFKNEPNYLGQVSANGSDYDNGKALGQWVIDQGFDTVVYANGGADFGVAQFVDRQKGFLDAVGDKVKVITVSGFPGDQFFADQAAALGTEGLDAVAASFNGVDFWAQPIASAGLTNVKLGTIGSVNQNYVDAFNSGSLSFLVAGDPQAYGFAVAMICNAVDGNAEALKENGVATKYATPSWVIGSAEDCQKLFEVMENQRIFTPDDFKKIIVKLNPAANAQSVYDLADTGAMENVLSK